MSAETDTISPRRPADGSEALVAKPTDPDFDHDAGYDAVTTPQMSTREVFARFWKLTRGDRRWMIVATILLIAAAAADTGAILLFAYIIDHVLTNGGGLHAFWKPAGAWAGITTLSTLVSYAGSILSTWVGERFVLRLRTNLHAQVAAAAPDFLDSTRLGDVLTRFTEDLEDVEGLVVSAIIGAATGIASAVMFSVAAIHLSPTLAVLALMLAPLLWAVTRRFSNRVGDVARAERANHSRMMVVLEESLANTALTRSSGRAPDEARRLAVEGRGWLRLNMRQARLSGSYSAWTGLLEMFAVIGVLGVGAWQISHHAASVGVLLAFSAYLGYLYPPLHALAGLPLTAASARASAARIEELLTNAVPVPDNGTLVPAGPGQLSFIDVSFAYPGRNRPALSHFDLTVAPGELLAITGASGAGKSTLAKLTARDHDPCGGTITLDGVDLRDYRLDALRAAITVLAQETLLFDATLADNIGYARPGASRVQVEAAARAAGLTDFVSTLPDGLETRVGQRGRLLSGGQRQRVAIARAFLRDAPLLILDEPTTGLDHDSATELLPTLRLLAAGRTTLMITHDQRLTYLADRIVSVGTRRPAGAAFGPISPWQSADADLGLPAVPAGRADRAARAPEPVPVGTWSRPPRRLRRSATLAGLGGLMVLGFFGTRVLTQQDSAHPTTDRAPTTSATAPGTTKPDTAKHSSDSSVSSAATDQTSTKPVTPQRSTTTVVPRTTTTTKPRTTPTTGTTTATGTTGTTTGTKSGTGTTTGTGTSTGTGTKSGTGTATGTGGTTTGTGGTTTGTGTTTAGGSGTPTGTGATGTGSTGTGGQKSGTTSGGSTGFGGSGGSTGSGTAGSTGSIGGGPANRGTGTG